VQARFRGKTYDELSDEERRKIDDAILHATVVRQEQPTDDYSSIYFVFERLNTGATPLTPQEIRNSIYQGAFRNLLEEFAHDEAWLTIFGAPSPRLKDQELILRFLALRYDLEEYQQPMKAFLNRFMGRHRELQELSAGELRAVFHETVNTAAEALGRRAFRLRTALNAAIFDAVMIGISRRLTRGPIDNLDSVRAAYNALLGDQEFDASVSKATANEENVQRRLALATAAFGDLR
jgi:hypothetical protein